MNYKCVLLEILKDNPLRFTVLLLLAAVLFASCTKSKICNKKASRELAGLNEMELTYFEEVIDTATFVRVADYFTPNADGVNDKLFISTSNIVNYNLTIGNSCKTLFITESPKTFWDGTFNGDPMPAGDYDVKIGVTYTNGQESNLNTEISLLK